MTPLARRILALPLLLRIAGLALLLVVLDYGTVPLIRSADRPSWSHTRLFLDHLAQVLGDGFVLGAMAVVIGLLGWLYGSRKLALGGKWMLFALLIAGFWTHLLKQLIGRPRPRQFALHGEWLPQPLEFTRSFDSFPSGHALALFSIAPLLGGLFPPARVALTVAAALLAFGRVYGGDHYPTDVAAGIWLGALIGQYCRARWQAEVADEAA